MDVAEIAAESEDLFEKAAQERRRSKSQK